MEIMEGLFACVEGNAMKRCRMTPSVSSSDSKEQLGRLGTKVRGKEAHDIV